MQALLRWLAPGLAHTPAESAQAESEDAPSYSWFEYMFPLACGTPAEEDGDPPGELPSKVSRLFGFGTSAPIDPSDVDALVARWRVPVPVHAERPDGGGERWSRFPCTVASLARGGREVEVEVVLFDPPYCRHPWAVYTVGQGEGVRVPPGWAWASDGDVLLIESHSYPAGVDPMALSGATGALAGLRRSYKPLSSARAASDSSCVATLPLRPLTLLTELAPEVSTACLQLFRLTETASELALARIEPLPSCCRPVALAANREAQARLRSGLGSARLRLAVVREQSPSPKSAL